VDKRERHERRYSGDPKRLRSAERIARLEVERVVRESLDGLSARTVLDVGTGTGVFAEAFAKSGLAVTGVDTNGDYLEIARRHVPEAEFRQGTAEQIPFADEMFDLVFLGHVLHEADDKIKALSEARRVGLQRVMILEWPYRTDGHGPPLEHRLRPGELEGLARRAGYTNVDLIELANMWLYRLDLEPCRSEGGRRINEEKT
jgi:ubiquinone/menaquinone biosynthesis C-methylase UbiE